MRRLNARRPGTDPHYRTQEKKRHLDRPQRADRAEGELALKLVRYMPKPHCERGPTSHRAPSDDLAACSSAKIHQSAMLMTSQSTKYRSESGFSRGVSHFGIVSEFNLDGAFASGGYEGLDSSTESLGIAIDSTGNSWFPDKSNSVVAELNPSGGFISGNRDFTVHRLYRRQP